MHTASRTPLLLLAATLFACGPGKPGDAGAARAVAELRPLGDSGVGGKVTFTAEGGKVRVEGDITGLTPGTHGFHIHEFGDCSSADGKSAGDHFNPDGHVHGGPGPQAHAGDFGNVEADAGGKAHLAVTLEQVTVDAGARGILGRGLIVHEKADDLKSQPAGDAGGRIACAVIQGEDGKTRPVTKS